jgi:hypothetical protein
METQTATNLRDQIDAPILKTVAGLNLMGLKTVFSCCGFNYKGQSDWKCHLMGKPYVFLDYSDPKEFMNNLGEYKLFILSLHTGWRFNFAGGSQSFIDFYSLDDRTDTHPWKNPNSVHFHETAVMAIARLNKEIEAFLKSRLSLIDTVTITDGNKKWQQSTSFWQFPPAADWTVTKEEWLEMPD